MSFQIRKKHVLLALSVLCFFFPTTLYFKHIPYGKRVLLINLKTLLDENNIFISVRMNSLLLKLYQIILSYHYSNILTLHIIIFSKNNSILLASTLLIQVLALSQTLNRTRHLASVWKTMSVSFHSDRHLSVPTPLMALCAIHGTIHTTTKII